MMMRKFDLLKGHNLGLAVVASASMLGLLGCAQPSNPELMAPPARIETASESKPIETTAVFQPKVDILFVIDNSDSMKDHQEKLKANIDRFVDAFKKNQRVDFQIGVTSIYDSIRYGSVVKTFHPLGQLYVVKHVNGSTSSNGLNFITRSEPEYSKALGETLKIGTVPFKDANGVDQGPENEELFTPVLAALDGRNVGFLRADAHLAVIMITDADDVSSVEPKTLKSELIRLKGNNASMVSAFAVLARTCSKVDPGIKGTGPVKTLEFIKEMKQDKRTSGMAFDLCDKNYGDRLAEAGNLIAKKSTKTLRIPLEAPPVNDAKGESTLKVVFHEGQPIDSADRARICKTEQNQLGRSGIWLDTRSNQVVVPGSVMEGMSATTTVQICYEKANMAKAGTPWLTPESAQKAK